MAEAKTEAAPAKTLEADQLGALLQQEFKPKHLGSLGVRREQLIPRLVVCA